MRTMPPTIFADAARQHDAETRAALARLIGIDEEDFTDAAWRQAQTPIRYGGLGMMSAASNSVTAFAGSWAITLPILSKLEFTWPAALHGIVTGIPDELTQDAASESEPRQQMRAAMQESLEQYHIGITAMVDLDATFFRTPRASDDTRAPTSTSTPLPPISQLLTTPFPQWQRLANAAGAATRFLRELQDEELDNTNRARLLSASGSGAGAFLTAIPSHAAHDHAMQPDVMRHAILRRLGLPIAEAADLCRLTASCPACQHGTLDATANHLTDCPRATAFGFAAGQRHQTVQEALGKVAMDRGVECTYEEKLDPSKPSGKRIDLVLKLHRRRRPRCSRASAPQPSPNPSPTTVSSPFVRTTLDVAVTAPTAPSALLNASRKRGARARVRAREKHDKYDGIVPNGEVFNAAVIETFGHIDAEFRNVLKAIAESYINQSTSDLSLSENLKASLRAAELTDMYRTISVALQSATVRQLRRTARILTDRVYNGRTSFSVNRSNLGARLPPVRINAHRYRSRHAAPF